MLTIFLNTINPSLLKELETNLKYIKKNPLNAVQLDALHTLSGSYEALFSKRAQLYKQRNLKEQALSETDFRALLLEHYTFLKRPVLLYDSKLFVGNTAKVIAEAKAFLDEQ